jgi:hypothetical protein
MVLVTKRLGTGAFYSDLGPDFYTRLDLDKAKKRALDQVRQMGIRRHPPTPSSRGKERIFASDRDSGLPTLRSPHLTSTDGGHKHYLHSVAVFGFMEGGSERRRGWDARR